MGLIILFYYYVTGFIALSALAAYRRWRPSDEPRNVFEFGDEQPPTLKMRLANVVLIPLAIAFFFIPLWPWILSIEFNFPWHKFKFWTDKAARSVPWSLTDEEAGFKVSKDDFLQQLSLADIEANERVFDPLQAVPDLPFGHLNKAWQDFANGLEPESELWSFRGRWKTQYRDYQMQGYVALQNEKIGSYFLTLQKSMMDT
ncbi:MAG: hypothetical protein JZU60_00475 [Ilumatobacteraceae bacterium]|jgi:hypothetical protein|nr:hypothetical protein [Ilumatobacteraceae bacterium]